MPEQAILPQLVRFAISSLISGGTRSFPSRISHPPPRARYTPTRLLEMLPKRGGQIVLLIQEGLLRDQDSGEILDAFSILQNCKIERTLGCRRALGQELGPFLSPQKSYQSVLHFLLGLEDGVLIGDQQLLEPGILHPDVVRDPAIIERYSTGRKARPGRCGSSTGTCRSSLNFPTSLERNPKCPAERESGIEIRLGHTDLGALSRCLVLGAPNIRPPAKEIGRDAHHDFRWGDRNLRSAFQKIGQVARRQAQQHAEGILGLPQLGFKGRNGSQGVIEHRFGLLHIQLRGGAVLKPGLGDLQALLLRFHVLTGNVDPSSQGS